MYRITQARHEGNYRAHIRFNDTVECVVDLQENICNEHRPICKELHDLKLFHAFRMGIDTIVWDNGFDLAPEFLRELFLSKRITGEIRTRDAEKAVEAAL